MSLGEWFDRHSGRLMVLPAVLMVLAFAIFPLIVSAYLSLSRFALAPGGYKLTFVGLYNYRRILFGTQQYHLLGTFGAFGPLRMGCWPRWSRRRSSIGSPAMAARRASPSSA